jgi:hypothetical protein
MPLQHNMVGRCQTEGNKAFPAPPITSGATGAAGMPDAAG